MDYFLTIWLALGLSRVTIFGSLIEYSENWFVLFILPLQEVGLTYLYDDLGLSISGVEYFG